MLTNDVLTWTGPAASLTPVGNYTLAGHPTATVRPAPVPALDANGTDPAATAAIAAAGIPAAVWQVAASSLTTAGQIGYVLLSGFNTVLRWLRFLGRSDPPNTGATSDFNAANGDYAQTGTYDPTAKSLQAHVDGGLTGGEHAHLMAIPLDPLLDNDPRLPAVAITVNGGTNVIGA